MVLTEQRPVEVAVGSASRVGGRDHQEDAVLAKPIGDGTNAWLLAVADDLYHRAGAGVSALPSDCRLGIAAARHIYAAIGGEVARAGHDSVNRRARTSRGQKLVRMGRAAGSAALTHVMPQHAQLHARPVPEVAFLVEAAGQRPARVPRSEALLSILAQLEARDRRGAV